MAVTVSALGLRGSNGNAFSAATRTGRRDFLQGGGGLFFGTFVDAGARYGVGSHGSLCATLELKMWNGVAAHGAAPQAIERLRLALTAPTRC